MIGDCIDADVRGAIEFGMEAIYFNEKKVAISNEIRQINQLIELKNIF
jgi:putative hydrolase of the HAD superfamily